MYILKRAHTIPLLFLFTLLLSFTGFSAYSNELDEALADIDPQTKLSPDQIKALRQDLKIQKILIEGIKGIQIKGGNFTNAQEAASTVEDLIARSFKEKTSQLPSDVSDSVEKAISKSTDKNAIRKILEKSKDFFWGQAYGQKVMLASSARRWGFDVGMVYLLSMQVDVTFPSIMIALGHVEYTPLLVAPVSTVATGAYAGLKSAVKFKHLLKHLGGMKSMRAAMDVIKKTRQFFNDSILPRYDLIDVAVGDKNYVFTIEKQNFINKTMHRFGWSKGLELGQLSEFLDERDMLSPLLRQSLDSDLPDQLKLLKVLRQIELESDQKMVAALQERFGAFIHEMEGVPEFGNARQWVSKISSAASLDEFTRLMMSIPDEIPPRVFDALWRKHILPMASKSVGPYMDKSTYQAFRNFDENWLKGPRHAMSESLDTVLDDHWRQEISKFFFRSIPPAMGCSALFNHRGDFAPLL